MRDAIAVFSSWDEYNEYKSDPNMNKETINIIEDLSRKKILKDHAMSIYIKPEYLSLSNSLFYQDIYNELLLSCIYTAKYLLNSNLSVNAIDLSYSYHMDNIGDPYDIEWLKRPEDVLSSQVIKKSGKNSVSGSTRNSWKKSIISKSTKSHYSQLMNYNNETQTIPFFMFHLTYLVLFSYGATPGIEKNGIKFKKYSDFCNEIFNFKNAGSDIDKILLNYKFEKIYKPWMIFSYQQLLKTQYKKVYFDKVKWDIILKSYNIHLPVNFCSYVFDDIAITMMAESENTFTDSEKQIRYFADNFEHSISYIKPLGETMLDIKKDFFYKSLSKYGGDINALIKTMEDQLLNLPLVEYKNQSIKELKDNCEHRFDQLNKTLKSNFQSSFFSDISDTKQIQKKEKNISKRLSEECRILFA